MQKTCCVPNSNCFGYSFRTWQLTWAKGFRAPSIQVFFYYSVNKFVNTNLKFWWDENNKLILYL